MEAFLKAEGGKIICASTRTMTTWRSARSRRSKEAGLKPGKDIIIVSIDAVPDIFEAMVAGEANATVE